MLLPVGPGSGYRNGHPEQLVLLFVDGVFDLGAHVLDAHPGYDG